MGRGRCQRRRERRRILTTRDNLIIPFFEPRECLESGGRRRLLSLRVRIWKREFDAKGGDRQEISMAAVLIAAFKRVHKRGRLTDKRKTAL